MHTTGQFLYFIAQGKLPGFRIDQDIDIAAFSDSGIARRR